MDKKSLILIAVVICSALTMAAVSLAQEKELVQIKNKAGIGNYLADSQGKTLYYFTKDTPGNSACTGDCKQKWQIYCYQTDGITPGPGLKASDFTWFQWADGSTEHLMYKGKPLYRFAGDETPGDTNGDGVKGVWFIVKP